ncbi:MAG: acyl-CoA dehydrogenase family protein [Pseudomonadota bacterium]
MDLTFTEDQLLFHSSIKAFLTEQVTPSWVRAGWQTETGRDPNMWQQLAELGLVGMTVPEKFGGLGMTELDFVLIAEECGYVALPEPLVNTVMVAAPLLTEIGGELAERWLQPLAAGEVQVAVALEDSLLVEDAHLADLLLVQEEDKWTALTPEQVELRFNESVDPSRKLYAVASKEQVAPVLEGPPALMLAQMALDRGTLGSAAQALGLGRAMVDLAVRYSADRQQFGKPIGSFQAVKHMLADVAVALEYAKAPIYRAAYSVAHHLSDCSRAVSHAKLAACEAANLAAKNSIQVHGAMGYTWDVDLHLFMKKAWALANSWGETSFHTARIADYLFSDTAALGAGATFSDSNEE